MKNQKNETEINKEEEIELYDTLLDIIENNYLSGNYNISALDNGYEEIIETKKLTITLTTTKNQKKINKNMTTVD